MSDNLRSNFFWGPSSALGIIVAALTAIADQAMKWWMLLVYDIDTKQMVTVAPFLDLVMVWNKGISYGLFQQGEAGQYLLAGFAAAAVLGLAIWLAHTINAIAAASIGLVMGGAVGNGIDRLLHGAVADFFSFHIGGYYWYVFNIADAAIVAGVVGLLYDSLLNSHKKV